MLQKSIRFILIHFLSVFILSLPNLIAQTNLSGIVNHYTAVSGLDTCNSSVEVSDTTGFRIGMRVMLIQMQGARINESNSGSFGSITDIRSAGLYEINEIISLGSNTVFLRYQLENKYNPDGKVQMVSIPSYQNARIIDTLKCQPWNGQTGGVLALEVANTLQMDAPVLLTASGFKGGRTIALPNGCVGGLNVASAYFYDSGDWRGSLKGEGIAAFIPGKESGRGAQANGGGGGNDHNSGGGGGGNVTGGGHGGERDSPFLTGDCKGENPGRGGYSLNYGTSRIFLGGGGGSGHNNNGTGTSGSNGGGILYLKAQNLSGSRAEIWNDGPDIPITRAGDGGGGGGAGGTVMLDISSFQATLSVSAKGGKGGDVNNIGDNTCFGPGGGGSGGVVLKKVPPGAPIVLDLSSGQAGLTTNSSRSCNNSSNGGQSGGPGLNLDVPNFRISQSIGGPPIIQSQPAPSLSVCEGASLNLPILASGRGLRYRWQVDTGTGFSNLADGNGFSGAATNNLSINPVSSAIQGYRYRVVLEDACGNQLNSNEYTINVLPPTNANFTFTRLGFSVQFINQSTGADTYDWTFGDGGRSQVREPQHTYAMDGNYTVALVVTGPCGRDTFVQTINLSSRPIASFSQSASNGCVPFSVQFQSLTPNATSYAWLFPGGNPSVSNQANPTVTYNMAGTYNVQLVVTNAVGADTLLKPATVVVGDKPKADFSFVVNGASVSFSNLSTGGSTYQWDFGDQNSSALPNPVHQYPGFGQFTVSLTANNACGSDTRTIQVVTGIAPSADFGADRTGGCVPFQVRFSDQSDGQVGSRFWTFEGGSPSFSIDSVVVVQYLNPGLFRVGLKVTNTVGSDSVTRQEYVEAISRPLAGFDFRVSGNQVVFTNTSQGGLNYSWDFGDQSPPSTQVNPVHTFPGPGQYFVTLNVLNKYCSSGITYGITIGASQVLESGFFEDWVVYPNPMGDYLIVEPGSDVRQSEVGFKLFDVLGNPVLFWQEVGVNGVELNVNQLLPGMYFLLVEHRQDTKIWKLVKP